MPRKSSGRRHISASGWRRWVYSYLSWAPVWAIICVLCTYALVQARSSVQALESELIDLRRDIVTEQQTIRVLQAEWAYLNRPERLKKLVAEFHPMEPLEPDRVVRVSQLSPIYAEAILSGQPLEQLLSSGDALPVRFDHLPASPTPHPTTQGTTNAGSTASAGSYWDILTDGDVRE